MDELLNNILNSTLSKILLIAGILLIVIAGIGKYKETIQVDKYGRIFSAIAGSLLLFLGIYYNIPEKTKPGAAKPDSTAQKDSAADRKLADAGNANPFSTGRKNKVPIGHGDKEAQAPVNRHFSIINDTRASIKLFECDGRNIPLLNERIYRTRFPKNSRFIYYELKLESETLPDRDVRFTIRKAYYNPQGVNICANGNDFTEVYPAGKANETFWGGWGLQNGWAPGQYTAVIYIDGVEKVRSNFSVME